MMGSSTADTRYVVRQGVLSTLGLIAKKIGRRLQAQPHRLPVSESAQLATNFGQHKHTMAPNTRMHAKKILRGVAFTQVGGGGRFLAVNGLQCAENCKLVRDGRFCAKNWDDALHSATPRRPFRPPPPRKKPLISMTWAWMEPSLPRAGQRAARHARPRREPSRNAPPASRAGCNATAQRNARRVLHRAPAARGLG